MLPVALTLPLLSLFGQGSAHHAVMIAAFVVVYSVYNISVNFTFASGNVMVNEQAMAPELREHVGAINGAGATLAAGVRAAGPALGGWVWSLVAASGLRGALFIPWCGVAGLIVTNVCIFWGA
jgi:hypothetical protein